MLRPRRWTTAQAVALALLVSFFAGCSDENDPNSPTVDSPALLITDYTGGHFTFLSPVRSGVPDGVFNPRLLPVVDICRLSGSGQPTATSTCASQAAWFGVHEGGGAERVALDVVRKSYGVTWNLASYALPTGYYRMFVRTAHNAGTTFAYLDVAVAPTLRQAYAMAGPGTAVASSTGELPIKFNIEDGALCNTPECFEGSVGTGGGVFLTNDEFAGVEFPEGALDRGRNLIIERVTADDVPYCLPTLEPQYEGCYRYRLEPALAPGETFALEAVVGVCLDPAAVPFEDELVLQKWDEVDPATLTTLPRREVEFLECDDFSLASLDAAGTFSTLASAGGRMIGALAQLFLPAPLSAGTRSPYGGGLNDFSRLGWVRPLSLAAAPAVTLAPSAVAPSVCAGDAVLPDPTVLVTSDITGEPAAGATIKFALIGGGSASPQQTTSDADGRASTHWTLGPAAGAQTLLAIGQSPRAFPNYTLAAPNWGTTLFHATAQNCDD